MEGKEKHPRILGDSGGQLGKEEAGTHLSSSLRAGEGLDECQFQRKVITDPSRQKAKIPSRGQKQHS